MKLKLIIAIVAALIFWGCNPKIDPETYAEVQQKGEQVAGMVQAELLANVGKAIQQGGPEYAVEFCNLKAGTLVDSLNEVYNCTIARISEKNRNPSNKLASDADKELWQIFTSRSLNDTIMKEGSTLVYYKPIKIALPACLKCHGNPGTDINNSTLQELKSRYPTDLATGYNLGDFRGLWKIAFTY